MKMCCQNNIFRFSTSAGNQIRVLELETWANLSPTSNSKDQQCDSTWTTIELLTC